MPDALKIETKDIGELTSDPANVRIHNAENIEAIKGSLKRFGQQKPIVVDHKGVVVAGNGTLEAARQIGWTDIQVVVTNLESVAATAFAIADNRTSEVAAWDLVALTETLKALKENDVDLADLGWLPHQVTPLFGATWEPAADVGEHQPMQNATTPDSSAGPTYVGASVRSVLFSNDEYEALVGVTGTPDEDDGRSIAQRILDALEVSV